MEDVMINDNVMNDYERNQSMRLYAHTELT